MSPIKPRPKQARVLADDDLSSIWAAVRAQPIRRRRVVAQAPAYMTPSVEPVIRWTLMFHEPPSKEHPRTTLMVIPGPTAHDRLQFYRSYLAPEWDSFRPDTIEDVVNDNARNWVDEPLIENLTRRVAAARVPTTVKNLAWRPPSDHGWELLWALIATEDFIIEEPLRSMVDQGHYLIHHLYKALWAFRFAIQENASFEPAAHIFFAITRWMTAEPLSEGDIETLTKIGVTRRVNSLSERIDLLLFLVTLAAQNGLLNRMVICFDGLERAVQPSGRSLLRELDGFLAAVDRWVHLTHTPIGIMIGFGASSREQAQLRALNSKLADRVQKGLEWVKPG